MFYADGLRPQPARLVRGSSRRIMAMRFESAQIRVINRRASSSADTGSSVLNPKCSEPTNGNVFPLRRPSTSARDARTVLGNKGTLRRGKKSRALVSCAPFRPKPTCDGRLP